MMSAISTERKEVTKITLIRGDSQLSASTQFTILAACVARRFWRQLNVLVVMHTWFGYLAIDVDTQEVYEWEEKAVIIGPVGEKTNWKITTVMLDVRDLWEKRMEKENL